MRLPFLMLGLVLNPHLFAQEVNLLAQAGLSSYVPASIGDLGSHGGGGSDWKTGPIVGIGARMALSQAFSVGATIEYSTHQYDPGEFGAIYDATNRVLDLNGIGRISFGLSNPLGASILGGIGFSYQDRDATGSIPGSSGWDVGAVLGVGLAVDLSRYVEIFLDGSLRFRSYTTAIAQIGIAYALI